MCLVDVTEKDVTGVHRAGMDVVWVHMTGVVVAGMHIAGVNMAGVEMTRVAQAYRRDRVAHSARRLVLDVHYGACVQGL